MHWMRTDKESILFEWRVKHDTALCSILYLQLRVREHPVHGPYVADLSA